MADLLYDAILGSPSVAQKTPSEGVQPISEEDLKHPNVIKGLQYINAYEGKPKANQMFGYREFNDLSKHPNIKIPFTDKGDTTTAAGTYQIIAPTWEEQAKKQGLKDFSPENQDRAAVGIMRDIGALDAFKEGNFDKAKQLLGTKWAGIPGSTIGKSTGQIPKFNAEHEAILPAGDMLYNAILGNDIKTGGSKTTSSQQPEKQGALEQAKNIGKGVASLADITVGSAIPFVAGQVTQAVARPFTTPEKAQEYGQTVAGAFDKPFGKALGITEEPAYKAEASQRFMQFVGENVGKGADWIAQKTGLPKQDVEHMITTLGVVAGPELGAKAKIGVSNAKNAMAEQFAAKKTGKEPFIVAETPPVATPEYIAEKGTASPYQPGKDFQELKYDEKVLPVQEQQARLQVLDRTVPGLKVDPNVIEGRGKDRATDYAVSKTDTPEGNLLAEKLKEEKLAKTAYGEKLINESGGTYGLDESANYKRGRNTIDYFQKLEKSFDDSIEKIYKERDAQASNIPVSGQNILTALTDEVTLPLGDNAGLAKSATAKLKQLGMMDKEGNMLPSNGFKAEQFRKWLNEPNIWDSKNAVMHRNLKNAVDADVISTLDPNTSIYADARNLFGLKKDTLENPNGISKILDAEGPNGINRKVDIEKIPNSIAGLGVDQLTHIIDTIDKAPPALKAQAEIARSEIKSQFLNRTHEAFERNANAGTKYLKDNKEVMTRLFTPEEMAKINDYNSLAHILKTDTGYPGSKVQEINLEKRLPQQMKEQFLKKGAALATGLLTGGHTMGIAETIAHGAMSERIAKKDLAKTEKLRKEAFEKKQKGFTNLKDIGK